MRVLEGLCGGHIRVPRGLCEDHVRVCEILRVGL